MSIDNARAAALSYRLLWTAYLLELLVLTLGTWVWPQQGREPSLTIWLVRTVPMLIFLPGLRRRDLRSCVWLCFVILLYFMVAVTEAMSPFRFWLNYIELLLTVVIFTSGMLFVRWQARALR